MIRDLPDTNATEISAALRTARRALGIPAVGMVLTLIIVTDEAGLEGALAAASKTAREHPSRILAVIEGPPDAQTTSGEAARLDTEIRICSEVGAGETVVLWLSGEVVAHADSVVLPLLVPEAPVVVWWPGAGPANPAAHPLGALANRRVTDVAAAASPLKHLTRRSQTYTPGDTDLAWTRTTPWRSILTAALDRHPAPVQRAVVESEPEDGSGILLAAWLAERLQVPVEHAAATGSPLAVRLHSGDGDITLARTSPSTAGLSTPDHPDQCAAMPQADTAELISEELRRLEPDDVYGTALKHSSAVAASPARTSA
ncbi:glucose-6-phosphate dehydrogenase assembly protein OpcA [Saccharopolyspora phatthalungensis]|uniref:Glucose-6-phosphate dehydrogenase assembly protein OpcA n=1 Tax=Saccharopolyspora phatthalungensis TaxID=664693 RepID=A0A840QJS3_9PSEU|nr:glucose-6-phosphate dehydrogenase assembly protein OpcA [Saccharopolyspora phatthalungensis]MBB5159419.1 glucose-6-phosphate dehydrogenase assembly protein OpcA [Saccharopolyspora phatthalungensis]